MHSMFSVAIKFNQPLDNWDTSKVENMHSMFYAARQFNQPLNPDYAIGKFQSKQIYYKI